MIRGLKSFKEWFQNFKANYIIIGGTACDLLMNEAGVDFRATKDIDMVLIIETLDADFGIHFWEYIKLADYKHCRKDTGVAQFYRFSNPKSTDYPHMIELFSCRIPNIQLPNDAILTPLPIEDDISSLSAILLNDEYYTFLKEGVRIIDGIPILDTMYLIPFKAKAWLDLTARKANGKQVDSKNIKKHKNDVIKLSSLLYKDSKLALPENIFADLSAFLNANTDSAEPLLRIARVYEIEK